MTRRDAINIALLSILNIGCNKMKLGLAIHPSKVPITYDPAAEAIFNNFSVQPSVWQKGAINRLVLTIKAQLGSWNNGNFLEILGLHTEQASKINWFNPSSTPATFNGTYYHHPNFGVRGDASSAYVNSHFNPSTAGGGFTLNDGEHMVFLNYADVVNSGFAAGHGNGTDSNSLRIKLPGSGLATYSGNDVGTTNTTDPGPGIGLYACKITTGHNALKVNGVTIENTARTITSIPNSNDYILAFNNNGSLYQPTGSHVYARMWCQGLSDAQSTAITNALNTFRLEFMMGAISTGSDKYMLLHMGQSNATQFIDRAMLHPSLLPAYSNAYNKDGSSNLSVYRPGFHSVFSDNGSDTGFMCAGNTAVWKLSQAYGKTVYYYNYSIGGSAMYAGVNNWNVSDNVFYATANAGISSLLSSIGSTPKAAMWWSQWNADADGSTHAAAWQTNMTNLINGMRSASGLGTNMHWFIERPHSQSAPNYPAGTIAAFNGYIDNLVANLTNVWALDTSPIDIRIDLNHYSGVGDMDLGIRMADFIYSKLG